MLHRSPFFLPWLYPQLTWRIPTNEKILYLTFDDGPVPGPTEFVLDVLKQYTIQATFFCIGDNVQKHPEVFSRILEEGHRAGNHTFHHLNGWKTNLEDYVNNVQACDQVFNTATGGEQPVTLFRPPYGRITRSQINLLPQYKIIMWDVLTHDYSPATSSEACLKNSIRATRPGSIIVFHDSHKAERNVTAVLPEFIEHFLSQGYSFNVIPA
jgi:peptidoglycan-N-acetylglucosamine deacetylase